MQTQTRAQLEMTIVARSTAPGPGAIAIVRLSGKEALSIGSKLGCEALAQDAYRLRRVALQDGEGAPLDDAMAVAMPGPKSYTGEDVLELHVHGGDAVVEAVLAACLAAGARLAEPGEFTLRAFVHGRLDLAQAEAVGALIHAQTDGGRQRALAALKGNVSAAIGDALQALEGVAAAWLSQLDFPDDTLDGPGYTAHERALCGQTRAALGRLVDAMAEDDDQPPHVVLMGAVNTGKSTLTNALCGYERALVDAAAGTTRDTIEVPLRLGGQRLHLWDTAGQRQDAEGVEARGITLGASRAETAAVVVWLCDGERPLWPPQKLREGRAKLLIFGARADTLPAAARRALEAQAAGHNLVLEGFVSGQTLEGVEALRDTVSHFLRQQASSPGDGPKEATMGNLRHRQHLVAALEALGHVDDGIASGLPMDLPLSDLQLAVRALGEIVGRDVDARVIDRIFSDFCIGK